MSAENYLNPFDDDEQEFTVLRNAAQQYSLWPLFAAQPAGWMAQFGPATRGSCLEYIESNWISINPFSTAS
ncbi:MbtH family protein [Janthinobacterium sp.]|uniref:MbtH family protein n=1 Tax=Janthinobacterium sp. TaxID=1871054 RepID=UPI00293D799E|nr:MbtH family protein [Janthinobacterium sp.]